MKRISFSNRTKEILEEHESLECIAQCVTVILTLGLLVLIGLSIRDELLTEGILFNIVSGDSMSPTLSDGQKLYTEKREDFSRLDIVNLTLPEKGESFPGMQKGDLLVKRVIGLPGEHIRIESGGRIYIGEDYLLEPYLEEAAREETFEEFWTERIMEIDLGPDEYFVMGDNRGNSLDSRAFGPVLQSEIQSAVSTSPTRLVILTFLKILALGAGVPLVFYNIFGAVLENTVCFIITRKESRA